MVSYYVPSEKIKSAYKNLAALLKEKFLAEVISYSLDFDELTIKIEKEAFLNIVSFLKDDSNFLFRQLIEVTAVDYPERANRFEVVYHFLSLVFNLRIRLKVEVKENEALPSIFSYYNNADWLEREVYDMYGIYFLNHPDLRRILTDFGFEGHPLRKDFPLWGFTEIYFDESEKKVKYKPVELENEYRDYNTENCWLDLKKPFKE